MIHGITPHGGTLKLLIAEDESSGRELAEKVVHLPRLNLTDRQLYDLEMLLVGGFSPLEGFLTEREYESVTERMRLPDGTLWPMPITLDVPEDATYKPGDEVVLCDKYGNPAAVLAISSVYRPDKTREARQVFGTEDLLHPGVWHLMKEAGPVYVGGIVRGVALTDRHDFRELRHTPAELRAWFRENGWERIVAFQTRNPIHRAHFEIMRRAAEAHGANILIHPVVGLTKEGDIDYITRVRTYKQIRENYLAERAKLALLPLAMRMAGPREALWHAIIRKNYGATHFIVGRDHAGPGKDSAGRPFYEPYAAQELAKRYESELGIAIVPMQEMAYVAELGEYVPADELQPQHTVKNISGTEFRRMLSEDLPVPEWFSFPEVIEELRRGAARSRKRGITIFFTGLSGAGKSTVANILYTKLLELQDRKITMLDGDVVRQNLSKGLGFSREDRDANIERIGFVANEITKHGGIAICSAIAPYEASRERNRALISKNGTYLEVHVATPIEVCKARDAKGLYEKAEQGILKNFTGVDDPYEVPRNPDIVLDTSNASPVECADKIIAALGEKRLLI